MRWVRLVVLMSVVSKMATVGFWLWAGPGVVPEAQASGQGEKAEKAEPKAEGHGGGKEAKKEEPKKEEPKKEEPKKEEPKKEEEKKPIVIRDPEPISEELLARSRAFRQMLTAVEERTTTLQQREQALVAREATLHSLEQTVGAQVARLKALAKAGGERVVRAPAANPADGEAVAKTDPTAATPTDAPPPPNVVAKIYESMKAEEAAPILDRMDDTIVRDILTHMKERQIGAILAAMSKDRAVAVTKALAASGTAVMPAAKPLP